MQTTKKELNLRKIGFTKEKINEIQSKLPSKDSELFDINGTVQGIEVKGGHLIKCQPLNKNYKALKFPLTDEQVKLIEPETNIEDLRSWASKSYLGITKKDVFIAHTV